MRKSLMYAFICLVVLFVWNHIGVERDLYYYISWYDIVSHFLGGVIVGFGGLWFLSLFPSTRAYMQKPTGLFLSALGCILFVGIIWEIFEVYIGVVDLMHKADAIDTLYDMVFDTAGTMLATAIIYIQKK